jgi:hypothetical protein
VVSANARGSHAQVLPWVDVRQWPQALRIGVTFTKAGEHVRIVQPPPPPLSGQSAITFQPLLPTTTA